ncbi:hypothetical protein TELCIR_12268, partial [Teladorsagia circumcincta]
NQWIKKRRVHSLLLQMNIAHLMVTLFYMPKEILHNYTIAWHGGDILCRTCKFFDVFGIALSMNILICISLDRFYSIFFPLYAMRARKSVQKMVMVAWVTSFATSAPQSKVSCSESWFREVRPSQRIPPSNGLAITIYPNHETIKKSDLNGNEHYNQNKNGSRNGNNTKKRIRKRSASANHLDLTAPKAKLSPVINIRAHSLRNNRKQASSPRQTLSPEQAVLI